MFASAASAAGLRLITTQVPRVPHGAQPAGPLPDSTPVPITVTLRPRDPAALQTYALAVADPASPLYHHYLSVRQFADRFGAAAPVARAVRAALGAEGL